MKKLLLSLMTAVLAGCAGASVIVEKHYDPRGGVVMFNDQTTWNVNQEQARELMKNFCDDQGFKITMVRYSAKLQTIGFSSTPVPGPLWNATETFVCEGKRPDAIMKCVAHCDANEQTDLCYKRCTEEK